MGADENYLLIKDDDGESNLVLDNMEPALLAINPYAENNHLAQKHITIQ